MALKIEEFVSVIGIEVDKTKLQNAETSLNKVKSSFIGIKTAILAASIAAFEFERRMVRGLTDLGNSSKILGASTKDFQVMEYAAQKSGIAFSSVTGAISKLNNELAEGSLGHAPVELLKSLAQLSQLTGKKISPFKADGSGFKEGIDLFKEVGAELKKLDNQKQIAFSNRIFGQNILPFFDKLKEARSELQSKGLLFSDKDVKDIEKVNNQFLLLGKNFDFLLKKTAISLAPFFEELLGQINDLTPKIIEAGKEFNKFMSSPETKQGLKDLITALFTIASVLSTIIKLVGTIGNGIANIFTGAGVMGFETQKRFEDLFSRFSKSNFDNLVMRNPQSSASSSTVNNTQNSNDNRVSNTTTHNNIIPSNMSSIYNVFSTR